MTSVAASSSQSQSQRQRQTATQTTTQTLTQAPPQAILRLRGAHNPNNRRSVQWSEDVVDNEGLGRKKSKGMCWARMLVFTPHRDHAIADRPSPLQCAASTTDRRPSANQATSHHPTRAMIPIPIPIQVGHLRPPTLREGRLGAMTTRMGTASIPTTAKATNTAMTTEASARGGGVATGKVRSDSQARTRTRRCRSQRSPPTGARRMAALEAYRARHPRHEKHGPRHISAY
jgi:protein phosphatase 1 regulatory subunit 11